MIERRVKLRDGTPVLIRPLTAADASLFPDFLREVSRADLRLRFFSAMREVSSTVIDRLIHYDPAHAMAFVALDETTGKALGGARLHHEADDQNGEFAILVRSDLKGRGLGWLMMKHLIAYAKERGLKTVEGQVLAENATMLAMCAELGFHAADDAEPGIKRVVLPLDEVPAEVLV